MNRKLDRSLHTEPVFFAMLREHSLPLPEGEVRFHPRRRWRFDYGWRDQRVALEVEGGVFKQRGGGVGRHNRGAGFRADTEKYNTAAVMGWTVIRVLSDESCTAQTLDWLRQALERVA